VSLSLQYNDKPIDQDHDLEAIQEQANHYHPTPSSRLPGSRLIRSRLVNNKLTKMSSSSPKPKTTQCTFTTLKCRGFPKEHTISTSSVNHHTTECLCADTPPIPPREIVTMAPKCKTCEADEKEKLKKT
jgi:hypothetical protein